ncbi:CENP-Q, a CENPA-CAD centromere complex subunit-domain-containing protein [Scheffersomyces coipomensis]|uniref:CENP-Q, a CENPA-CAD centromere complex subunit-domain-containing protein n=1 Tax=Scheffersomyces coipomensis TaxID=1788519 RepID=UPI00315CC8A8
MSSTSELDSTVGGTDETQEHTEVQELVETISASTHSTEDQTTNNNHIPDSETGSLPNTEESSTLNQEIPNEPVTEDQPEEGEEEEEENEEEENEVSDVNKQSTDKETVQEDSNDQPQSTEIIPPPSIRPHKRKLNQLDEFKIIDPNTAFTIDTNKKKIPARIIDEFWEPLNKSSLSSFESILNIALTRTLERYGDNLVNRKNGKLTKKTVEAQRIITKTWINSQDSKSLLSRLSVTKVPTNDSVSKEFKSNQDDNNILSFDQLLRRKKFLETYLGAELKQLQQLEKTYNELNINYQLDSKYLQDFKKTTLLNINNMQRELNDKRRGNNIPLADEIETDVNAINDLNLQKETSSSGKNHFNPNTDEDTKELLTTLNKHLTNMTTNTKGLKTLNEKLETLYNILDML